MKNVNLNNENLNTVEINTDETTSSIEFTIEYQNMGNGACVPVVNGKPEPILTFGYTSEADKEAFAKILEKALKAAGGNAHRAGIYIMQAIATTAAGIKPTKEIVVEGVRCILDLNQRKLFAGPQTELANLDDIKAELPDDVVEAFLVERAKNKILNDIIKDDDEDDYNDEDDE